MDWTSINEAIIKRKNLIILLSGSITMFTYLAYSLVLLFPLVRFEGLVEGHYSFLNYHLVYNINGEKIILTNTEYTKLISLVFLFVSLSVVVIAMIGILDVIKKKNELTSAGLILGISASALVSYGLFNGYLKRVLLFDINSFSSLLDKDFVSITTNAGTLIYPGIKIKKSFLYSLVIESPEILLVCIIIGMALSGLIYNSLIFQESRKYKTHQSL